MPGRGRPSSGPRVAASPTVVLVSRTALWLGACTTGAALPPRLKIVHSKAGKIDPLNAQQALALTTARIVRQQKPDGSWLVDCDAGPVTTAYVTTALRFAGHLDETQARATASWLERRWLGPGRGYEIYPGAGEGDLGATAAVWAALHACGRRADDAIVHDLRQFVERHGGQTALLERFRQGDLAALFLAMVGLFPPTKLPPPPAVLPLPGVDRMVESRVSVILPFTSFVTAAITKSLRPGGRSLAASGLGTLARGLETRTTLRYFERFRNEDGSWLYGDTYHASLVLAAMFALGVPDADPRVVQGRRFLSSKRREGHYPIFDTDVWTTAFLVRALLQSGTSPGDPAVWRAVEWLCGCQRGGGWAFQSGNTSMLDNDDAGVVIASLAMATDPARQPPLPYAIQQRARRAILEGRRWLFGRQNPDGGWASFQVGLPGKRRGPIMTTPPCPPGDDIWSHLTILREAAPDLGDPATEDVTARVLFGLGRSGSTVDDQEVARAVAFLGNMQDTNGGWWGRWTINYLAGTAWVLRGLRAVGADMQAPWIQRGVRFLTTHQNPDGGWGESAASYSDLGQIGQGPSTPGLTGLVVCALLDAGSRPADEPVTRARSYLLGTVGNDGSWARAGELHALLPPRLFYELPETENQLPLEALGMLAQLGATSTTPAVRSTSDAPREARWSDEHIRQMRGEADPVADALVAQLAASGELRQVNGLYRLIVHSGDPLPAELPGPVREYFQSQAQLPRWADPLKLELAHGLFERYGFSVATALFCSSLPQCFAFPDGARVLGATSSFEANARRRVLETSQFVFDVAARRGLTPDGRGIRAAQKVRLMHAAIRWHSSKRERHPGDGLAINQQQLVGTMLSFSLLVTDALRALGFEVRDDEAEAWFHLWRVTGVLLGIEERHLPADRADGARLMDTLRARFWGPSPEGAALAKATLAVMEQTLPGRQFAGLPVALVRHLAGDRCADLLELPRASWTRHLIAGGAFILDTPAARTLARSALAATAQQASFALMRALGELNTGEHPVTFHVPSELRRQWAANDA